ncbi:MAG: GreA/GreB family elongation factor [Thiotrichales bacterium]|jgi:transcription elongation factor GreB|nr:GreA/GreB family elongation factor [Thiotrichales bacterium]
MSEQVPTHKYLTPDGYAFMKARLNYLLHDERPKTVQAVSEAAAMGDRSENAEYIYGKKKLREIDRTVRWLQTRLDGAKIIHELPAERQRIFFGAQVVLEDEQGVCLSLRIVGVGEQQPERDYICVSLNAPMARALLGKTVDDEVVVADIAYTVIAVNYAAEFV